MVETGSRDNVCVICKLGGGAGKLLGCKKNNHLKCVDAPLKGVPPSDWYCFSCVKKRFLPGAVESNLDTIKVELADSQVVDTAKNILCSKKDSNGGAEKLKRKPVRVAASDSKFVEYWVPAKLSNVQLEQYCDILLSNSILLRSCSKAETLEALCDVLISIRKCCDHPYFVNPSLQKTLMNGLLDAEFLNVGIKASGKLQVLDTILSETKKQGLRVLIIFQSAAGSSGISLGDVLDDVCQRCGEDSYERVDCGLSMPDSQFSKIKQAALNRFNDKDKGRIVFLLDRRACHSSIKLSSVDIVILYDSDLNPYNDLKLLQKITIDSQHEQLKLFRLYSVCTLEEMGLVNAKQDVTVDAQNLNRSTIHQMPRWGASYLFKELSEFHGSCPSSGPVFSSEHLVKELFSLLPQDAGSRSTNHNSIVVRVDKTGGTYSRDISLPGELEMHSADKDLSHDFWTKLLNRKTPRWRYLDAYSQFSAQSIVFQPEVHLLFSLETIHQTFNKLFKSSNHNDATSSSNYFTCEICTEPIPLNEKFKNMEASGCFHPYCTDCVAKYIEIKVVHNNLSDIKCPNTNCFFLLDALSCRSVLPRKVFEKWCRLL
ncbi:helicase protein MOM1-like [Papaver somniferum]|uniref:helicase protein MOM1-like n=1 Tax=Papaver somniferum TaxID=3469 RepID=UPI000E6F7322|nr:helicase protein MOM1-like [Papaver somniferum]